MARIDDDTLITSALLRRFQGEANLARAGGQYFALIRRSNGELLAHNPFSPELDLMQMMWAEDVLKRLNRELHHDGAWVVVFTDPKPDPDQLAIFAQRHAEYARYALLWVDPDGDVQFAQEWVRGESEQVDWADVLMAGIHSVMNKAETSWQLWHTYMRDVIDPGEGQTFRRARGERAASTRH